jgi:chemotaxis protein methyltransferase CheR
MQLGDRAFDDIRKLVYRTAGIKLADGKRDLVVSRLSNRITRLGFHSYEEYIAHVERGDPSGEELRQFINRLTTNKTDFFRESHHFEFLQHRLLDRVRARVASGGPKRLRIWSAGCSTGEEPYTIAMVLLEALGATSGWDVRILASDIDTNVLATAAAGLYPRDRVATIPEPLREAWFDDEGGSLRVRNEVKNLITFRRINFMDEGWPIRTRFDAVFCRNVTIYFDRPTQERLYRRLAKYVAPDGFFIAGHSENLSWLPDVFESVGNTVYRLAGGARPTDRPGPRGRAGHRASAAPGARVFASIPPCAAAVGSRTPAARALGSGPPVVRVLGSGATSARTSHVGGLSVTIQSGEVHVSTRPTTVRTVLGTCVAACLWDPEAGIGGMNHFMLPEGNDPQMPARFGVNAMELLINQLMAAGADRSRLRAKAFGGAQVLGGRLGCEVAERNAAFVRSFLAMERIPLVSERFGGTNALEVEFQTDSGRAFLRQRESAASVLEQELKYKARLLNDVARGGGNVELF